MEETASDVPVRIRRAGFDLKTTPESLVLDRPVAEYQVSLLADGDPKRTWRYPGVDAERPLLVFDQASGVLLPWKHSLPARCLWLLFPGQLDLQVEGQAHCLEELPRLPWGWAGFRGQCWNLESATSLILREDEQTVLSIAVRPDETAKRPYLVGGRLFSPGEPGVRPPVSSAAHRPEERRRGAHTLAADGAQQVGSHSTNSAHPSPDRLAPEYGDG